MRVVFIPGDLSDKARAKCYKYLRNKYRKEKQGVNDSDIREGEHRRAGQERIQPPGSAT